MTKKHFERAAKMVYTILHGGWSSDMPDWANSDPALWAGTTNYTRAVQTAEAMMLLFCQFNPKFDKARFLKACGL